MTTANRISLSNPSSLMRGQNAAAGAYRASTMPPGRSGHSRCGRGDSRASARAVGEGHFAETPALDVACGLPHWPGMTPRAAIVPALPSAFRAALPALVVLLPLAVG